MQTSQFFLDYTKYTSWTNAIVQNVKTWEASTLPAAIFTSAQLSAAITQGGIVIDQINTMQTQVYLLQGITQPFTPYDNTVAGFLKTYQFGMPPQQLGVKEEMEALISNMITILTANQTAPLIDSYTNAIYTKPVAYTNAETAAIAALTNLLSVINYVAVPLTNTVAPVISGSLTVGSTLTVTPGTWTGNTPISLAHQWIQADDNAGTNAVNIAGQTGLTYVIAVASGKYVTVKETATELSFNYETGNVTAAYVGPVV